MLRLGMECCQCEIELSEAEIVLLLKEHYCPDCGEVVAEELDEVNPKAAANAHEQVRKARGG